MRYQVFRCNVGVIDRDISIPVVNLRHVIRGLNAAQLLKCGA